MVICGMGSLKVFLDVLTEKKRCCIYHMNYWGEDAESRNQDKVRVRKNFAQNQILEQLSCK